MPAFADLAAYRLVQALRAGQPGAYPSLWNAHAGSIWTVVRALVATDADALGWTTSFRVELAELVGRFDAETPLSVQIGMALYTHLAPTFSAEAPMGPGPLRADEAGVRSLPERARLLYLLTLYFDLSDEDLIRHAGPGAPAIVAEVTRRIEPGHDTDAHLAVHATLLRTPPAAALILPPGAEPPQRSRLGWWVGGAALLLGLAATPWVRDAVFRTSWEDLGALHSSTLSSPGMLIEGSAAELASKLSIAGVPSDLLSVPELEADGLTLLGGRVLTGVVPGVVLVYSTPGAVWTLQHHGRGPPSNAQVLATDDAPEHPTQLVQAGDLTVATWTESGTLWVLGAAVPGTDVLAMARSIRAHRARQGLVPRPMATP